VRCVVLEAMDNGVPITRRTALIPLVCVGAARALLSVFRTLFTPTPLKYRIVDVDTRLAKNLYRDFAIFVVAGAVVGGIDWWLELLTLPNENRQLVAVGLSLVLVLMISVVCIAHRRTIGHMLVPAEGQANPLLLSLARSWWVFAIAYLLIGWMVRCVNVLLGTQSGSGLIAMPVLLLITGFIAYGVARLILARLIAPSPALRIGVGLQARRLRDYHSPAFCCCP
jgi:hypothetical protein